MGFLQVVMVVMVSHLCYQLDEAERQREMTTLSEQEKDARNNAFELWSNTDQATGVIAEWRAYRYGFEAGLAYNQKRIEELEAKVKELENKLASYVWMKD